MRMIVLVLIVSFLLAGCSDQNKESSSSYPSAVAWNNINNPYAEKKW